MDTEGERSQEENKTLILTRREAEEVEQLLIDIVYPEYEGARISNLNINRVLLLSALGKFEEVNTNRQVSIP